MSTCDTCHISKECLIEMYYYNELVRYDEIEYKQQKIIDKLYDIIEENLPEEIKNEYEIFIYSKNIFIKDV